MASNIMEVRLGEALSADAGLAARGCTVSRDAAGGVAILRAGAPVGTWHWRNGAFELVEGGAVTASLDTVAEAVRHTRDRICGP